ncbi:hypothetical protein NL676_008724 [Syzygium grande]|nr:hypothetical protein NL676_008724 [Syzygium grande]
MLIEDPTTRKGNDSGLEETPATSHDQDGPGGHLGLARSDAGLAGARLQEQQQWWWLQGGRTPDNTAGGTPGND